MKYMKKLLCLVLVVLCAAMLAVPAAAEETAPAVPTATVTPVPEAELDPNVPLTFALKFVADEVTEEQLAYYGNWYADFELTLNKTATFCAGSETADGYLSGQYDEWYESWVSVPFTDVTLEANVTLKIMEYAASLMGQSGLKVTYNDVYIGVKEFDCGVFFTEEYLAANPDLIVTLSLQMYNPADETQSYSVGPVYTFYAAAATVTDAQGEVSYYPTLEDALDAAKDGSAIVLRNDVVLAKDITVEKNLSLDLNGHAVSGCTLYAAEGKCVKVEGEVFTLRDHDLKTTEAKAATYTSAGNTEYHTCSLCSKLFSDKEGKIETSLEKVTIPQLIKVEDEKAEIKEEAVDTAISEAVSAGTAGDVVLDLNEVATDSAAENETPAAVTSAELPVASLEKVASISEEATLTISMADATVVVDAAAMEAVAEQAEGTTVTLKVEQIEAETLTQTQQSAVASQKVVAAITASFVCREGKEIHDFQGGSVTVAMPFTPEEGTQGSDYIVIYVADDGTTEEIPTTFANNTLVFTLSHFSEYVIVNTNVPTNGSPATGDVGILSYAAAMLLSGAGMMAILPKKREEI